MDTGLSSSQRDAASALPSVHAETTGESRLTLTLAGRLDSTTTGEVWRQVLTSVERASPAELILDAGAIDYCDMSGIGLLVDIQRHQQKTGGRLEIRNLSERFQRLYDLFDISAFEAAEAARPRPANLPEEVGRATCRLLDYLKAEIAFIGELTVALIYAVLHPRKIRWKDAFLVAETAGVNSLPMVVLISFMIGWIIAFQSAIPMRQFGAEIFVADLIAITMLRELGPLMTALLLAGRTGSAFAAELGTMKVNEEIDALTTMGLDPVRFLVTIRVTALALMTPLLTVIADLMGVIGGAFVLLSMGYPLVTYTNRVLSAVTAVDLIGGLVKACVFGFLIAGIGCFRGLRTKTGASAVGESTTGAVVTAVILIILVDGIFGVVYYCLGI